MLGDVEEVSTKANSGKAFRVDGVGGQILKQTEMEGQYDDMIEGLTSLYMFEKR